MQSSPYPALTNYAICIKRHQTSLASYCGITFAAATQGDGKYVVWTLYVEIAIVVPERDETKASRVLIHYMI